MYQDILPISDTNSQYIGAAGEYRVASELLLRGINVGLVAVDDGVDLIEVSTGMRIQVKTSRKEFSNTRGYKYPAYIFTIRTKKYISSKNVTLRPRFRPEKVDFVILWGIDHNLFYIIPTSEVVTTQINISIDPARPSKYELFKGSWNLLINEILRRKDILSSN